MPGNTSFCDREGGRSSRPACLGCRLKTEIRYILFFFFFFFFSCSRLWQNLPIYIFIMTSSRHHPNRVHQLPATVETICARGQLRSAKTIDVHSSLALLCLNSTTLGEHCARQDSRCSCVRARGTRVSEQGSRQHGYDCYVQRHTLCASERSAVNGLPTLSRRPLVCGWQVWQNGVVDGVGWGPGYLQVG